MRTDVRFLLAPLAAAALLAACSKPADPPAAAPLAAMPAAVPAAAEQIAWRKLKAPADVDAAFAEAKAAGRPLMLYWGASWCPPCNQLQATLFQRQDFIARTRAFVPVYVDGDQPSAQKVGERFGVRAYPTLVLLDADGRERTRLPGEVDPEQVVEALTLGLNAQRPVAEILAAARSGGAGLAADDWRLLGFYSWETDTRRLVPEAERAQVLAQLAAACPPGLPEVATRLRLKALSFAGEDKGAAPDATGRAALAAVLADAKASRRQADVLVNAAPDLVRAVSSSGSAERRAVQAAFDGALRRFEADTTLSRGDRLMATIARVQLARIDVPAAQADPGLPDALRAEARAAAERTDRETTNAYERDALVPTAAYLLAQTGLVAESDALLQKNLAKSGVPYYLMSSLASNATRRGDVPAALDWSEKSYAASVGPSTRLQWGVSHLERLVELAPADAARIEAAAAKLVEDAAKAPDAFHERSGRSMQRLGAKLGRWEHAQKPQVLARLKAKLDGVCAALPAGEPARGACDKLFVPPA
jgi:thiol-disulfide isomerase/thioredoxin